MRNNIKNTQNLRIYIGFFFIENLILKVCIVHKTKRKGIIKNNKNNKEVYCVFLLLNEIIIHNFRYNNSNRVKTQKGNFLT